MSQQEVLSFHQQLLNWFSSHGRHDLPWQIKISPYRVWVSEIMLQQTQVATVIPYFTRFVERFPNIESLAQAAQDDVLHHWTGLGYYARARNLHLCAKKIVTDHQGKFPRTIAELASLPGIGRSTAGAIMATAFETPAAILDGNVKRVLARYFLIAGWPGNPTVANQMWEIAQRYTPDHSSRAYTQAIMDLGSLVCTRSKPRCDICPIRQGCRARALEQQSQFPEKKPKKELPTKKLFFLFIRNSKNQFLFELRPPLGIWGGLWSVPEISIDQQNVIAQVEQQFNFCCARSQHLKIVEHTFSHFHLQIHPLLIDVTSMHPQAHDDRYAWLHIDPLPNIGLAAPIKKLLLTINEVSYDTTNSLHET